MGLRQSFVTLEMLVSMYFLINSYVENNVFEYVVENNEFVCELFLKRIIEIKGKKA